MTTRYSPAVKVGVLSSIGIDEQFDLSKLYIFAGTEPATAEEALDMVTVHTELVAITNNGTATGLTFGTATAAGLPKTALEVWKGTYAFDGAEDGETTLTPVFYRLCAAGDDGRALANASTGYRFQGSVGGPGSGADLVLGSATVDTTDEQTIEDYSIKAV